MCRILKPRQVPKRNVSNPKPPTRNPQDPSPHDQKPPNIQPGRGEPDEEGRQRDVREWLQRQRIRGSVDGQRQVMGVPGVETHGLGIWCPWGGNARSWDLGLRMSGERDAHRDLKQIHTYIHTYIRTVIRGSGRIPFLGVSFTARGPLFQRWDSPPCLPCASRSSLGNHNFSDGGLFVCAL